MNDSSRNWKKIKILFLKKIFDAILLNVLQFSVSLRSSMQFYNFNLNRFPFSFHVLLDISILEIVHSSGNICRNCHFSILSPPTISPFSNIIPPISLPTHKNHPQCSIIYRTRKKKLHVVLIEEVEKIKRKLAKSPFIISI